MEAILKVENLTKIYNQYSKSPKTAIDKLSLTVNKGDFVAIMGPSGCGKTTLINLLSTVDVATSGKIQIYGENILLLSETQKAKLRRHDIALVFQNFNLISTLRNRDNILFSMRLNNSDTKAQEEELNRIAKQLDIVETLDKYPHECSGGQQQRIAIARAMITHPKIIFADEPTGNIDSLASKELMELFVSVGQKNNTTIVMVTHDSLVASYATKLYYLKDGQVQEYLEKGDSSQEEYYRNILKTTAQIHI